VDAYAKAQKKLTPEGLTVDAIWNGDGKNPNAWLTVLRHETNVSVMKGRQGGIPRSQWLVSYSGLERLYYDTVASFKYWEGDLGKLETLASPGKSSGGKPHKYSISPSRSGGWQTGPQSV
jgi:hypothetical protein